MATINANAPLTPFDNDKFIDTSSSDGIKKYSKVTERLKEKFDLTKQNLRTFLELLKIDLQKCQLMKVFDVVTDRPTVETVTKINYFDDPGLV